MQKSFSKHSLKLGIFVSYRDPTDGGGYTITQDILNTILKRFKKKNLFFIILNDKKNILKKKILKSGYKCESLNEFNVLLKIKSFIFSLFPFLLKLYNLLGFNQYLNTQKKNSVDIVWFLSAEYYYPLFSKYISTVWDLQHLTHSSFPETGSIFIKMYRERVINKFLKNSYNVISGSSLLIKLMKKHYNIETKKIIYNQHPTPEVFLKKKKYKNKINYLKNFFLYPANFWQHKNHINLLEGFKKFNNKNNNKYTLVLVGHIKDKKYFKKIKNKFLLNSIKDFKVLSFVSLNYLVKLYDNCLALIYSSYAGPENLPPLEAMARTKPIICSNYPGAKEQLQNIPIYFNPYSSKSIESALDKFIKKKTKSKHLIKPTIIYVQKLFDRFNIK